MGRDRTVMVPEALTPEAFAPFGWLPVADTDPADGANRLEFTWQDPHVNVISHGPEEIVRDDGGICCDRMYRHETHTQALLVLDHEAVMAVAPAGVEFREDADAGSVRVFRLVPHDALVLHRGTWHWGPFPVGTEAVHLYNVQGKGYERDNVCVDLTGLDLRVETSPRPADR